MISPAVKYDLAHDSDLMPIKAQTKGGQHEEIAISL
jgi:hypothetical protein